MSKNILVALLMITLANIAHSQSVQPGYLSISPSHFFRNTFLLSYETGIGKDKTIAILPGVILKQNGSEKYKGFQAEIQSRFYLLHPSFANMEESKYGGARIQPYVAPYYSYMSLQKDYTLYSYNPNNPSGEAKDFERNTTAHSGGVIVGCRINFTKNLFIDFNAGGGFRFADIEDTVYAEDPNLFPIYEDYNIFDYDYTGITPKIGFLVGIRLY